MPPPHGIEHIAGGLGIFGKTEGTEEREELRRLRREIKQVREERDILGKATAFFAKEKR